jgi:hypothetical protein
VTGLGIISPVGNTVAEAWENIDCRQESASAASPSFDPSAFKAQIAGEVKNFDVTAYLSAKEARRMDSFIHYGMAAGDGGDSRCRAGYTARPKRRAHRREYRFGHRRPADDRGHAQRCSPAVRARSRPSSSRARSST